MKKEKEDKRKVKRVEVEKVKNGKGGHLHKVTAHYHDLPAKEGKGMKHAFPEYQKPEETFHTSPGATHKHIKGLVQHMTAEPDEEFDSGEEEPPEPNGPVGDTGAESEAVDQDAVLR